MINIISKPLEFDYELKKKIVKQVYQDKLVKHPSSQKNH
jgi:hypothetical protein